MEISWIFWMRPFMFRNFRMIAICHPSFACKMLCLFFPLGSPAGITKPSPNCPEPPSNLPLAPPQADCLGSQAFTMDWHWKWSNAPWMTNLKLSFIVTGTQCTFTSQAFLSTNHHNYKLYSLIFFDSTNLNLTPLKTNMSPEKWWLED